MRGFERDDDGSCLRSERIYVRISSREMVQMMEFSYALWLGAMVLIVLWTVVGLK